MVSMKDIAVKCGVSIATVSKALNGQPDIGEETRERVRRTADEMGYMTNSAARALKTNRTYNIGVLFVDQRSSGLTHECFSAVLESLKAEAERNGYDITFITRAVGRKTTSYLQHCQYRGVDGVVIASVDFRDPMVEELIRSSLPVVTIDHIFSNRIAVLSDNVEGMEALTEYVVSRGHRDLAFLYGEMVAVTEKRLAGFHRVCQAHGIVVRKEWMLQSRYHDSENCYQITKRLLEQEERPTCIFFPDDFSYIGGLTAIREAGLRVPEDLSVVGYDGIRLSQIVYPRLTTYRQNTLELGRAAAARLIEQIEHPMTTLPEQVIISGELVEGESVAQL